MRRSAGPRGDAYGNATGEALVAALEREPLARRRSATRAQAVSCFHLFGLDKSRPPPDCRPRNISGGNVADTDLELLQGTLDVLVLKTLTWGPRHGYAVARWIRDTSDAALHVEDRALYVALHRLEHRGWVESAWGLSENNRKAKYYQLTAAGRAELQTRTARWARYAGAVSKVLATP